MELVARKDVGRGNTHFTLTTPKGTKYSVVDFKTLFKSSPELSGLAPGHFNIWEAIKIKKDGSLDGDVVIRANSKEELFDRIIM